MNRTNKNSNRIRERHVFCLLLIACCSLAFFSCKEKKTQQTASAKKDVYYTCSMHPQVKENHPGDCPICGMKLIAVPKTSMNASQGVHLNEKQIQIGNIQVDTVTTDNIGDNMVLTGMLNFHLNNLSSVNARIEGRVEKLYIKNIGDYVHKGEKLYDLYSEQLNNAKQEYVTALEQEKNSGNSLINYSALVESAKHKLLLWGMAETQVNALAQSKQVSTLTIFYSPEDGYTTSFGIKEGDYVMEGGNIVQVAKLGTFWAEAQVYSTQMAGLDKGGNVVVQIPDLNNLTINGKINFINPEINPDTRINLVRVVIPNIRNELHPGMPVYIIIKNRQRHSITLPSDAVLTDGKGSTVWVQTSPGAYEIRMVETGVNDGNIVEIKSGLHKGDVVVTSGAYLINSEYIFENGNSPMAGMDMSNMKM
jgi:Cu(I)/Ag(I) efflux system membrane fusion protein